MKSLASVVGVKGLKCWLKEFRVVGCRVLGLVDISMGCEVAHAEFRAVGSRRFGVYSIGFKVLTQNPKPGTLNPKP